jgi:hypothetical protein
MPFYSRTATSVCKKATQQARSLHIRCHFRDEDRSWELYVMQLIGWMKVKKKSMPFAVSMIWRQPTSYPDWGFQGTAKVKCSFLFLFPFEMTPMSHGKEMLASVPSTEWRQLSVLDKQHGRSDSNVRSKLRSVELPTTTHN